LHRLFPAGEEALACRASLKCHLASALLRSVSLIETALQCETVAKNPRCQVPTWGLDDCRIRQTYSRRDVLGCSRENREKNGSTTSKKKTVTTPTPIPRVLDDSPTPRSKKPHPASALGVRTKKRQEPLDKTGSFREVAPNQSPLRQCHPAARVKSTKALGASMVDPHAPVRCRRGGDPNRMLTPNSSIAYKRWP
jgi:hypothetical protein